ncbi:MAG TPA: CsbD family protein [Gammaproteobacteria bacterium]|nr:CsbD family protein [Gammaproteobacteria bacterium]
MPIQDKTSGTWLQVKGAIKEKWGKLTDNDLTEIEGSREKLVGKLVNTYSMAEDQARKEANEFWKNFDRLNKAA